MTINLRQDQTEETVGRTNVGCGGNEGASGKKMVGPIVKREAVAHLQEKLGLPERRTCKIIRADRKVIRYQSCRPPEIELRTRLRDLANERRRFGYRRLFILLHREGEPSGSIYRINLFVAGAFKTDVGMMQKMLKHFIR